MENDILDSLTDLGYDGPLSDEVAFSKALEGGPKSVELSQLIHLLAQELKVLCKLEETVNPMKNADDSSSFLLELSSFLKELGCPYKRMITGHMSSRLQTKEECLLLLDYLVSELMAARMVNVDQPKDKQKSGMEIVVHESPTAKYLKEVLMALKFNKPPPNITPEILFCKLEAKLKETLQKEGDQLVGKPLYNKALTEKDWKNLEMAFTEMFEEYSLRREMLITRLECTVQSCEWSDRLKGQKDKIQSSYRPKREKLKVKPDVKISDFLAARTSLLHVEKTSSASVRKNTQSQVNKVIIGQVPDRGGRPNEQQPPPPEMPSWQQRTAPQIKAEDFHTCQVSIGECGAKALSKPQSTPSGTHQDFQSDTFQATVTSSDTPPRKSKKKSKNKSLAVPNDLIKKMEANEVLTLASKMANVQIEDGKETLLLGKDQPGKTKTTLSDMTPDKVSVKTLPLGVVKPEDPVTNSGSEDATLSDQDDPTRKDKQAKTKGFPRRCCKGLRKHNAMRDWEDTDELRNTVKREKKKRNRNDGRNFYAHLEVAVALQPSGELTWEEAKWIKMSLLDLIAAAKENSKRLPTFMRWASWRHGVICIWCEDQFSLDWLISSVNTAIPSPRPGTILTVIKQTEINITGHLFIPSAQDIPLDELIQELDRQNLAYAIRAWALHSWKNGTEPLEKEGKYLTFGVPMEDYKCLIRPGRDCRLTYELTTIYIRFETTYGVSNKVNKEMTYRGNQRERCDIVGNGEQSV